VIWLILGVIAWSSLHLLPSLGRNVRGALIARLGEGPYKGLFSLSLIGAIAAMIVGWRSTPPVLVYSPPAVGIALAKPGMFLALVLFFASGVPSNIKRFVRHPQLTGVTLWSLMHLLANGESRSLILFGGLGLWAIASMVCINRRDGAWQKPDPLPARAEIKPLVAGVVGFAIFYFAHPWIAGVKIP